MQLRASVHSSRKSVRGADANALDAFAAARVRAAGPRRTAACDLPSMCGGGVPPASSMKVGASYSIQTKQPKKFRSDLSHAATVM